MGFSAIVLAAGMGKRMGGNFPKVLFELNGKSLIDYVTDSLSAIDCERIILVVGFGKELVKVHFEDKNVEFAVQEVQRGTGDAVKSAIPMISDLSNEVFVLCGDVPLIPVETFRNILKYHRENKLAATVLTVKLDDAGKYGRIVRNNDGFVERIVEAADASPEELEIKEINSGTYVFDKKALVENIDKIDNNNAQGEYYLTDILEILKNNSDKIGAYLFDGAPELLSGVNKPEDLRKLEEFLNT